MPDQTPDLAQAVAALRGILAQKQQDDAAEAKAIAELDTLIHTVSPAPAPPPPKGPGILSRTAAAIGRVVRKVPYQWVAIALVFAVAIAGNEKGGLSCARLVPHVVTPVVQPTGPIRAVIVHSATAASSAAQLDVINSTAVRSYLDAHCVKDGDGTAAWRVWDKDVDVAGESAAWQTAWASAKPLLSTVPAIAVWPVGKSTPIVAPLPADEAAAIALLSKYGGK